MADFQCWPHAISHPGDILPCHLATLPSRGGVLPLLEPGRLVTWLAAPSTAEVMLCAMGGDAASPSSSGILACGPPSCPAGIVSGWGCHAGRSPVTWRAPVCALWLAGLGLCGSQPVPGTRRRVSTPQDDVSSQLSATPSL